MVANEVSPQQKEKMNPIYGASFVQSPPASQE